MTVTITRLDQSASDLHVAAAQSANAKITRRLLALTFVLDAAAAEAARSCGEFGAYLSARRNVVGGRRDLGADRADQLAI
jgi:hypothetical protein